MPAPLPSLLLRLFACFVWILLPVLAKAQSLTPTATPTMLIVGTDGTTTSESSYSGSAPLHCRFVANASNLGSRTALYEWRFVREKGQIFLRRYEAETSFDFLESGSYTVQLFVSFVEGTDTLLFEQDSPFQITISESRLDMPNAFTPNGDGVNDIFKAKDGFQSLISFRATILSRSGRKLFTWTDPTLGWDGNIGGNEAPDGAYYLVVEARGADGRQYNIRKTINLLRHHDPQSGN